MLLLPSVAPHLALELVKALNLLRGKDPADLGTNIRIQPDLIRLRRRKRLGGAPDLGFVKRLVHYCSIERLPGLSYATASRDYVVVVAAPDLLDPYPLRGRKPNRLHHSLLQLLSSLHVGIQRPIAAWLGKTEPPLPTGQPGVATNLTLRVDIDRPDYQGSRQYQRGLLNVHFGSLPKR